MSVATITNIQKFSLHDGPGIRTTIFFKGCPLNCWWCHNPESHSKNHQIIYFEDRCTLCGTCVRRCPENALEIKDNKLLRDKDRCVLCEKCTDFCPNDAQEYVGKDVTTKEIMKEILKDIDFYEESGGGVTFSGGEPMIYSSFLEELLKSCNNRGIHTAIDTSGYVPWENFEKISDKVDLFLFDLKLMDDEKHKKYTGVSNVIILENLKKLSNIGANIYIRMPIIAGINDDSNIDESINFLSNLNIIQVNLLPYHKMGMDKYKRLGMKYKLTGGEKPSDEKMIEIANKFKLAGIKIKMGG